MKSITLQDRWQLLWYCGWEPARCKYLQLSGSTKKNVNWTRTASTPTNRQIYWMGEEKKFYDASWSQLACSTLKDFGHMKSFKGDPGRDCIKNSILLETRCRHILWKTQSWENLGKKLSVVAVGIINFKIRGFFPFFSSFPAAGWVRITPLLNFLLSYSLLLEDK